MSSTNSSPGVGGLAAAVLVLAVSLVVDGLRGERIGTQSDYALAGVK